MFRLAAIGAKEGVSVGVSKVFGTDITIPALRTTDENYFKIVDGHSLHDLMIAVTEGAERPATTDVRQLYVNLCSTTFYFRSMMVVHVKRLRSQAAKSNGYSVSVSEVFIVLIGISNI